MKVMVERGALLKGIARAAAVVEKKSTIPILSNVLLEADGQELRLTATDLEITLALSVPAGIAVPGVITVEAALLQGIVREVADGAQVELTVDDGFLRITAGRARYKLRTLPGDEFPKVEALEGQVSFAWPAASLRSMLGKVAFAQSTEETRYYLMGVHLEHRDGALFLAATNGHVLASARMVAPECATEVGDSIVPRKTVGALQQLIAEVEGELEVAVGARQVRLSFDGITLTSRLIEGTFPDWRRVVPQSNPHLLKVNREAFAGAIRRAMVVSNDKERKTKIDLATDKLTVSLSSHEHGEGSEELPVDWSGPELGLGFNARYLLDTFAAIGSADLEVRLGSPRDPTLFTNPTDDTAQWVVMPMSV